MPNSDDIQQQLALLRVEFAASLVERVNKMIDDLKMLNQSSNPDQDLQDFFRQLHSLSGSAGTFGFNRLSEQARQLELIVKEYINIQTLPDQNIMEHLSTGLNQLFKQIEKGPDNSQFDESIPAQDSNERLLYVVEDDPVQGQQLCLQLNHYGFKTQLLISATETLNAIKQKVPDALLIDIMLPEGQLAGTKITSSIRDLLQEPVPSIFISSRQDWESRLAAVRAGGVAYLNKPVDISVLVDHLDRITQRVLREPYRVLIIDDVFELAHHYALILRKAGMFTEVLTDTSCILEKIENFKPELILLDYYLADINGMEVAQVLRQHPVHFGTPIVFLSTETDPEIQLETLRQGDDFLQKPIMDNHLVSTVESRVERARALNQLMYNDGLTGLLNQVTLKRRLESELARCQRQGSILSYIMLDLDHFKQVNDQYGHMAGDQVLKSLAHLLRSRLRRTDTIGRYGGEEFGVIMADTSSEEAFKIIKDLHHHFNQISYQAGEQEFNASFSAGIACSKEFNNKHRIIEAADETLYQAKEKGRNRVLLHKQCIS